MPTDTITVTLGGDGMHISDGAPLTIGVAGDTATIYRVRAKKSVGSGYFAFNIDASSSKSSKYNPLQDALLDLNATTLSPVLSDGDDMADIPDSISSKEATAPSGSQPTFASSGTNITSKPAIDIGSSSRLQVSTDSPTFASSEPFSVILVVDQADNSNKPAMGSNNASGRFSYATWYGNNASRQVYFRDESNNSINGSGTSDYIQDEDIRVLTRDSSNVVEEYRRGVKTMQGTISGTCDFGCIGWLSQNFNFMNQDLIFDGLSLSRVIVVDDHLDDDTREEIEAWLAWEYGLQTASNTYLPSTHVGYQSTGNPIISFSNAFTNDIDISSLGADTWSDYYAPNTSTVSGTIDIIPARAYKAGTVTLEILLSY